MKISVNRIQDENGLTFTIQVTDPKPVNFTEKDLEIMKSLDLFRNSLEEMGNPDENALIWKAISSLHAIQDEKFDKTKKQLTEFIDYLVESRIKHISREIYNWIYDHQPEYIKKWMQEFDPERTKYYFDNDKTIESDWSDNY